MKQPASRWGNGEERVCVHHEREHAEVRFGASRARGEIWETRLAFPLETSRDFNLGRSVDQYSRSLDILCSAVFIEMASVA